jgi:hypothetical protein
VVLVDENATVWVTWRDGISCEWPWDAAKHGREVLYGVEKHVSDDFEVGDILRMSVNGRGDGTGDLRRGSVMGICSEIRQSYLKASQDGDVIRKVCTHLHVLRKCRTKVGYNHGKQMRGRTCQIRIAQKDPTFLPREPPNEQESHVPRGNPIFTASLSHTHGQLALPHCRMQR